MKKLAFGLILYLLIPTFLFVSPIFADFPSSGQVGYWKMDEIQGQTAFDGMGANNGQASGTFIVPEKINYGRLFNGSSDYIAVPYNSANPLFNITSSFTYALWVNPGLNSNPSNLYPLIGRQQCNNAWPAAELFLSGSGPNFDLNLSLNDINANTFTVFTAPASISLFQWNHVAVTYNQSASTVNLFVNGTNVKTASYDKQIWSPSTPLFIGGTPSPGDYNCWSAFTNGIIDEVGIWNRTLSEAEIKDLYAYPTPLPTPSPAPIMQEYYVSPSGNDNNPGTPGQPFQTLGRAKEVVRTKNQNMSGNITIFLRGGYYPVSSPLLFDQNDSGTNGFNIIYQNYPGEIPLISGGRQITGWQEEGNKWKAYVGTNLQTRQLYVNGNRAIRARSAGGLPGGVKTSTGYTTTDTTMQSWQNPSDIEVVANAAWKQFRCGVQSISSNAITMKQPCFANAQAHGGGGTHYDMQLPTWMENAYELLDQPGEWYLNRTSGWIYYLPRPGEDMTQATVIAPILETLISGRGTRDTPIHNIVFKGLALAYATWLRPNNNDGYAVVQGEYTLTGKPWSASDLYSSPHGSSWTQNPANISMSHAQNIQFIRNIFIHLGAVGLTFNDGSKNNRVEGNHFTDISAAGIVLGNTDKPQTSDDRDISRDNQILDNYIHNVATEYQASVGLWVGYTQNSQIIHNELYDLPYDGISIGWGWGLTDPTVAKNNLVQNNLIHDHMKVLLDGGGLYSLSAQPGNIYSGNVIRDGRNDNGAIYFDNRSRYITAHDNIIVNNAKTAIFKGGNHAIYNNWWQERTGDDVRWLGNDPMTRSADGECTPTPCGPNIIANNHKINTISDALSSIVTSAGVEQQYQDMKALPTFPSPGPTLSSISGDINRDGKVDIFDYNLLVTDFGKTGGNGFSPADLNADGKVDIFDYNLLVTNFGKTQ